MRNNIKQYLSEIAQKIIPYQWEDIPVGNVLRFDTNTLPNPSKSLPLFLDNMKRNCQINEYSDPGYKNLKRLIADYEKVKPEMISITNSGDEGIDVIAKAFLNKNDFFIITPPTYEMFEIQCRINGGIPVKIPLKKNTWEINEKEIILKSRNPRTKIIFLVNPNNPTASIIPLETIERIVKYSKTIVVVDEVYREFYGETVVPRLFKYKNLVVLRSMSKFAALAGARVGYLISNPEMTSKFESIRFPMGVSYLSCKFAETVLRKDKKWIQMQFKMIIKERKKLSDQLSKLGFFVYPSFANFLLVKIRQRTREICRKLKKEGIIVRDRSDKELLKGCIRITVRSSKENEILIKKLKAIL